MDFILEGLPDSVKDKVGKCSSAKELWDKLHNIYSSPITESEIAKEDTGTEQEEDAHHVRQIQKRKSTKRQKLITENN
jgi:hypothetical protein